MTKNHSLPIGAYWPVTIAKILRYLKMPFDLSLMISGSVSDLIS